MAQEPFAGSALYRLWDANELRQGDVFASLLTYRADSAAELVSKRSLGLDRYAWDPARAGNHVVLPAVALPAMVISHDCAIDKDVNVAGLLLGELSEAEITRRSSKTDVIVAPIRPVPGAWNDGKLEQVANGDVFHQFLLPPDEHVPWAGGYVDLRYLITYRLSDLMAALRLMSLQEDVRSHLQSSLGRFFAWR